MISKHLLKFTKIAAVGIVAAAMFPSCTKSSNTAKTGIVLPAGAITSTTLNKGNVKGVLLADSTYTVNGDITVLPTDTLTVQPGATINLTGNYAFYIQGVIRSVGSQDKPITFTSTVKQAPGQWGGFQCDSAKAVTFQWTKILWAGGLDATGSTTQTISVSVPINVDIEDCWLIGGQDNSIGVFSTATVKILRNTMMDNGLNDGEGIDFHSGVTGDVAYNVIWGQAGSAIKVYTSATIANPQTNVNVYNNTCVDCGFRRGAAEPGRAILVDAFSKANVYNNLIINDYWGLDITTTADVADTKYGNNYFYATIDSVRAEFYPVGDAGVPQSSDIINLTTTGANDPMFVAYPTPPNPTFRIPLSATDLTFGYDFHVKSGSPTIGKGNSVYNNDIGAYTSDGQGNKH